MLWTSQFSLAGNNLMSAELYDRRFFDRQSDGSTQSARELVPKIVRLFPTISSVVDIGCGVGAWLAEFESHGISDVLGVDGFSPDDKLRIAASKFHRTDLEAPISVGRRFDLALSMEVGEHLSKARANSFVADLCALSDCIVFSAAIPGQGGTAHVNERRHSYWAAQFSARGYDCYDGLRRQIWRNDKIEWWYRQNVLLFVARSRTDLTGGMGATAKRINAVHPEFFRAKSPLRLAARGWQRLVERDDPARRRIKAEN